MKESKYYQIVVFYQKNAESSTQYNSSTYKLLTFDCAGTIHELFINVMQKMGIMLEKRNFRVIQLDILLNTSKSFWTAILSFGILQY